MQNSTLFVGDERGPLNTPSRDKIEGMLRERLPAQTYPAVRQTERRCVHIYFEVYSLGGTRKKDHNHVIRMYDMYNRSEKITPLAEMRRRGRKVDVTAMWPEYDAHMLSNNKTVLLGGWEVLE